MAGQANAVVDRTRIFYHNVRFCANSNCRACNGLARAGWRATECNLARRAAGSPACPPARALHRAGANGPRSLRQPSGDPEGRLGPRGLRSAASAAGWPVTLPAWRWPDYRCTSNASTSYELRPNGLPSRNSMLPKVWGSHTLVVATWPHVRAVDLTKMPAVSAPRAPRVRDGRETGPDVSHPTRTAP